MEQAVRPKTSKTKSRKSQSKKEVHVPSENATSQCSLNANISSEAEHSDSTLNADVNCDLSSTADNQNSNDASAKCSSVVPEHFYKLCTTKPSNVASAANTNFEEFTAYSSSATASLQLEPSAPIERPSLDSVLSPTAPMLTDASLEAGEFDFDQSYDEIVKLTEETAETAGDVLPVLPVQEDEWEFGGADQNQEKIYPNLEQETSAVSANLEPFTEEQRSMFYHNVLIEHVETYVEQFLNDANDYHDRFKTLLTAYYQARQQLIKVRQKQAQYQETVQTATQKVFVTQSGRVEAEAYCHDQRKVSTVHHYETCHYDAEASNRLDMVLREDRRIAGEEVAFAGYSSTVARLHCEQCLFEVAERHERHRRRLQESPGKISPSSVKSSILLQLIDESVGELKAVCNVLFLFIRRRKCKDNENDRFWNDIEKWVTLIIYHLVQSCDCVSSPGRHFSEEMFVLNHVLRCPPGLHRWASGLVQISGPSMTRDGSKDPTSLDHSVCLLYLILKHPKERDSFLAELKDNELMEVPEEKSEAWTLIDDDGDEVDTSNLSPDFAILPLEADLITLFSQMPLEGLISSILHMTKTGDAYHYTETRLRSEDIMITFATCDVICDILGNGLIAFGHSKYKQLVRRVAQTTRNVALIVSQHWQQYKLALDRDNKSQRYSIDRLQLEFDEFYKRCVSRLLAVAKLGIYQFVADLSYHFVSSKAADTLYLLMNVPPGVRSEVDTLISEGYSKQEWLDFIEDPDTKLAFEDHLSNMPTNEIVYLLTTFANLAQARPSSERHLLTTIAIDIFKVSFMYKSTRDVCSKTGRELLSSVASYHPFIITTLIKFVEENMNAVSSIAIYAMSDLPFSLWEPTGNDVTILRSWILANPTASNQCRLAQIIIQGINFEINSELATLHVPLPLHQQIALLLVEACVQIDQQQAGLMMKSIDQVTKVASSVRLATHPSYQQFIAWSWRISFRLKLHQRLNSVYTPGSSSACNHDAGPVTPAGASFTERAKPLPVLDISTNSVFFPILQASKVKQPLACYVALLMGTAGHRMDAFMNDGLEYAHTLALHGHLRALLHMFDCVMPMFYGSTVNLGLNQKFSETLTRFLHCTDEGIIAGVANYLRADNSAPESSATLLSSIIDQHVTKAEADNGGALVLSYWMQVIMAITSWYKDAHFKHLLDYILKSSFAVGEKSLLECRTMLYDNYVELVLHGNHDNAVTHSKNVVTSFIQMVSGGHQESPSFVGAIASSENIYFKFESLVSETRYEDDCELWPTVLSALRADSKLSIESAVKKANSKLKLAHNPTHSKLALYRWAELALHTPHDHPFLPLVWYNFFLRFIFLPTDGRSSLGCRFFDHASMLSLYNKLRLRLQGAMEYHHGIVSSKAVDSNHTRHHELLVKLYQSFKLWLEEPKMHECNLYLPSLPAQYNSRLLALVRTRSINACDDIVDKPKVRKELVSLANKWNQVQNLDKSKRRLYTRPSFHHLTGNVNTQERITHLLKQFESPVPMSAEATNSHGPPVAVQNPYSLQDFDSVLTEIDQDIKIVSAFANQFSISESKHHRINRDFLSLLPQLYFMKATELVKSVECQSAFSATHKCSGGATVEMRFKQKTLNESISERLKANRNLYKNEIANFTSENVSGELSYACLHVECVIRALEANFKNPTHTESLQNAVNQCGTRLFYLLADMYSGERVGCLLTRKFLANAVELLGQIFVSQSSDEASHVLQQVINNPDSAPLLSPHFAPGSKSRNSQSNCINDYIEMYHRVVKLVSTTKNDNPDVLFVLLTKFEMSSWLDNFNPSHSDRIQLLEYLMIGMVSCNMKLQKDTDNQDFSDASSPVLSHKASHATVHEVYLNHLTALLSHNFPLLFIDVLRYLLEASRTKDVAVSTWETFLQVSFSDPFLSVVDPTRSCSFCSSMNWNTLQNAMEILVTYFNEYRNSTSETRSCGLYLSWQPYIEVCSQLITCVCHTYLTAVNEDRLPLIFTETKLTADPSWNSIVPVCDLFGAWFQPTFVDPDTRELGWAWKEENDALVKPFLTSYFNILKEFCQRDKLPVSSYLNHVWSSYINAVKHEKQKVPAYIYNAHHSIMDGLPWNLFVPELAAFDQMIQISDGRNTSPILFLCTFVPKLSWTTIIEMCRNPPSTGTDPLSEWNPITSEVLCRLLHLLLSLGSNVERLEKHEDLLQLFSASEALPWRCVNADQFDHLCHLACDRYSWTSPLMLHSVKYLPRDPRNCAFRLLKFASGLPLTGEEKGSARTPVIIPADDCNESDWQKMQRYIKTVGQLLQKMKVDDKMRNAATKPLIRFVERTNESIEMTSKYRDASKQLPELLATFFNYLNVVPSKLQSVVCESCCSVLSRKAICSSCASVNTDAPTTRQCQDCVYLRSRSLSPLTLLSTISAICDSVVYAAHTTVLLDEAVVSYMDISSQVTEGEKLNERANQSWKDILSAYRKPITHKEEFIKYSLQQGCVISLYVFSLEMIKLDDFHASVDFIKNEHPNEQRLKKLYESAILDVQWLSSMPPMKANEGKFFLIWDHFLCICAILFKVASLSPMQGFTIHSVIDTVASLLPVLEQISQDKVKTGILGSFGIGTQSSLSVGFRLATKGLLVYLKHWIAKANATSTKAVTTAQNTFEAFKSLPVTNNKVYLSEQSCIESACLYLSREEVTIEGSRKYLAIFVKHYFPNDKFLSHFATVS